MFTSNMCMSAVLASILGIPSDELDIVRVKAAVLSKTAQNLETVTAILGIDEKRFEWTATGHTADVLMISHRSLSKNYSVSIECKINKGSVIVTNIRIHVRK